MSNELKREKKSERARIHRRRRFHSSNGSSRTERSLIANPLRAEGRGNTPVSHTAISRDIAMTELLRKLIHIPRASISGVLYSRIFIGNQGTKERFDHYLS